LGLPHDLYLAKRYYDMALQIDGDTYLAVYLSLVTVGVEFVFEWYATGQLEFWGMQWDSILLVILTVILFICVIIRQLQ